MNRTVLGFFPLALWAAAVLVVGSLEEIPVPALPRHGDKVGHFFMYGVGGALAAWAGHVRGGRAGLTGLIVVLVTGAVDELHQATLATRHGNPWDWVADAAGAMFFFVIASLILRRH